MDLETLKKLISKSKDLLKPDTFAAIEKAINLGDMTESMMDYIAGEIETARNTLEIANEIAEKGNKIYADATEKNREIKREMKDSFKQVMKDQDAAQQEQDSEEAEKLITNL